MEPFYPFQIPIWGIIFNAHKLQSVDYRSYITKMTNTTPTVIKNNIGGWQSNNLLHDIPIFKELFSEISYICDAVASEYLKIQVSGYIDSAWANVNYKHSLNLAHIREGDLSGTFHLKAPDNSGNLIFINPAVRSQSQKISINNFVVVPEELAIIIFPSWLEHYVEPNKSDEQRITISFNYKIKEQYAQN